MTKLYALNYFLVQFLFFRVCRYYSPTGQQTHWGVIYFVLPFTGWNTPYKTIGKMKDKRVIKCSNT